MSAFAVDQASNVSPTITRQAAFDNVAPAVSALTQSPAAVASLGTVTVSGTATDNFDLASSKGNLQYSPAGYVLVTVPFASVAGTAFRAQIAATHIHDSRAESD